MIMVVAMVIMAIALGGFVMSCKYKESKRKDKKDSDMSMLE
jgi:hypothetical protein